MKSWVSHIFREEQTLFTGDLIPLSAIETVHFPVAVIMPNTSVQHAN